MLTFTELLDSQGIELFAAEKYKDWFETAMGSELRELHAMAMIG